MEDKKFNYFISILPSKKNVDDLILQSTAPLAIIILTKEFYQNNKDLKLFVTEYLKEDYKDYLFAGRPALYARIIKDIVREENIEKNLIKMKNIQKFLLANNEFKDKKIKDDKKNTPQKNKNTIENWSRIINPKGN